MIGVFKNLNWDRVIALLSLIFSADPSKLHYGKKVLLRLIVFHSDENPTSDSVACCVRVINISHNPVAFSFFGLAYRADGQIKEVINKENPQTHEVKLEPNDTAEVHYFRDVTDQINPQKIFLYAKDIRGKTYTVSHRKMKKNAIHERAKDIKDMIMAF